MPDGTKEEPLVRTVADEAALLEKGRPHAQQKALARLAAQPDPGADQVLLAQFERYHAQQLPPALWLDLFEAAAKRDNPELKAMLAERERELAKATDPLVRFRECLEGGDADSGRLIFTKKPDAGCIRCHSVDGKGGQIGPELTWLRHSTDRIRILESLILPNSTIAMGFEPTLLKLKTGEEIPGVITSETSDDLVITSVADGRKRKLKTADIAERTPLPSPMPPHFGAVLSKREIRDLIEFLAEGD
ncbi:MAG: quinoprotein glucose dehydrogenase [Chthoniobacter sp.]|nr:quinoprotein glucose dehydrogenase [Chthoniobacter sp.]